MRKITTLNVRNFTESGNPKFTAGCLFKPGDVKIIKGKPEALAFNGLPLQVDQWNRHPKDEDSVGFAILSGVAGMGGEQAIYAAEGSVQDALPLIDFDALAQRYDGKSTITSYHPKKIGIYYSNRQGNSVPGAAFDADEVITVELTNAKGEIETAIATVEEKHSGPGVYPKAVGVSWNVINAINKTKSYRASPGYEERTEVTTLDQDGGDFTIKIIRQEGAKHRPGRKAGALVVLVDGELALYLERGGKTLLTASPDPAVLAAAASALVTTLRGGRLGRVTVERADGTYAIGTPVGEALEEAGFERMPRGLRLHA